MLFIGNKQCLAVKWKRGLPESWEAYSNSDEGRSQFESRLQGMKNFTVGILADLVEEDYRLERVPHLNWRDRRHFFARKLEQYYRYTPFRNASIQGNEGKEDRVLFSALTSPNLVLPWIELLTKKNIAISGVCSVAMLSDRLISEIPASHLMLLSFQNGTGLRQSFFLNGSLNFSRLTLIHPDDDPLAIVQVESERAYHYLHALNLLPEGRALLVCILCGREDGKKLEAMLENTQAVHHVFIDPAEVMRRIGFKGEITGSDGLPIFMHLLSDDNQYGTQEHTHIHDLGQWLRAAYAFSASLVVAGLILAGFDASRAVSVHARAGILWARKDEAMLRLRSLVPQDAGTDSPEKMKAAVMLSESLSASFPQPAKLLSVVSRSLSPFQDIRIDRVSWKIRENPESGEQRDRLLSKAHPIAISVEGEIYPFDGNFRKANETVGRFCSELKNSGMGIESVKLPLNLNPDISLAGKSGKIDEKAVFSVKALWKGAS